MAPPRETKAQAPKVLKAWPKVAPPGSITATPIDPDSITSTEFSDGLAVTLVIAIHRTPHDRRYPRFCVPARVRQRLDASQIIFPTYRIRFNPSSNFMDNPTVPQLRVIVRRLWEAIVPPTLTEVPTVLIDSFWSWQH